MNYIYSDEFEEKINSFIIIPTLYNVSTIHNNRMRIIVTSNIILVLIGSVIQYEHIISNIQSLIISNYQGFYVRNNRSVCGIKKSDKGNHQYKKLLPLPIYCWTNFDISFPELWRKAEHVVEGYKLI